MPQRIPVVIGCDVPEICHSLAGSFSSLPELSIVGVASDESALRGLAKFHRPAIAILNFTLAFSVLRELMSALSANRVSPLIMDDFIDETQTVELLQYGLKGLVPVAVNRPMLCKSVRAIASGEIWINRRTVDKLVNEVRALSVSACTSSITPSETTITFIPETEPPRTSNLRQRYSQFNLTRRECEIVEAITEGMTNKEIASAFGISEFTVKHHLAKIFDKFGVYTRLELATFAAHHHVRKYVARDIPSIPANW